MVDNTKIWVFLSVNCEIVNKYEQHHRTIIKTRTELLTNSYNFDIINIGEIDLSLYQKILDSKMPEYNIPTNMKINRIVSLKKLDLQQLSFLRSIYDFSSDFYTTYHNINLFLQFELDAEYRPAEQMLDKICELTKFAGYEDMICGEYSEILSRALCSEDLEYLKKLHQFIADWYFGLIFSFGKSKLNPDLLNIVKQYLSYNNFFKIGSSYYFFHPNFLETTKKSLQEIIDLQDDKYQELISYMQKYELMYTYQWDYGGFLD